MALLSCPECRRRISDSAVACPRCGSEFGSPEQLRQLAAAVGAARTTSRHRIIRRAMLFFVVGGVVGGSCGGISLGGKASGVLEARAEAYERDSRALTPFYARFLGTLWQESDSCFGAYIEAAKDQVRLSPLVAEWFRPRWQTGDYSTDEYLKHAFIRRVSDTSAANVMNDRLMFRRGSGLAQAAGYEEAERCCQARNWCDQTGRLRLP